MSKTKSNPPRYLNALLVRAFSKEGSKDYRVANEFIERANKKIELGDGKVSPAQK
jgi:hypothetical protein